METNTELTDQDLADVLNAAEGTSFHPWIATHIPVGDTKFYIDRNESESRWMVVTDADETTRLEVEYIDGRGWMPAGS